MATTQNNRVLGRGELYFAPFLPGTQTPTGERYLGNTPAFGITLSETTLDHYNSDGGVKELDDQITLEVKREGSFSTDNIQPANVALFFFGAASKLTTVGATVAGEEFDAVAPDLYYQLGVTPANPTGVRNVTFPGAAGTAFKVKNKATPTTIYTAGTDYDFDAELGRLHIIGGAIANPTDILVDYTYTASTRDRIISGSTPVEGQMRFIAKNPAGKQTDYLLPWVKLTPDGEYALKGDTWQEIKFKVSALKKSAFEAIYADGRAYTG